MSKLKAPWTHGQVINLINWQTVGFVHPYMCREKCGAVLTPTIRGWECAFCDYTQDWCHDHCANKGPGKNPLEVAPPTENS